MRAFLIVYCVSSIIAIIAHTRDDDLGLAFIQAVFLAWAGYLLSTL